MGSKRLKRGVNHELFAATPPLEALRILLSQVATRAPNRSRDPNKKRLLIMDVSRAFFYAPVEKLTYVELPDEEGLDKSKYCGRWNFSQYGTREAPGNRQGTYTKHLIDIGFVKGRASTCVFWHPQRDIEVLVHGDDYVAEVDKNDLLWFEKK